MKQQKQLELVPSIIIIIIIITLLSLLLLLLLFYQKEAIQKLRKTLFITSKKLF